MTLRPFRSIREITSPMRLRRTASGLTKIRVRSGTTAPRIVFALSGRRVFRARGACAGRAGCSRLGTRKSLPTAATGLRAAPRVSRRRAPRVPLPRPGRGGVPGQGLPAPLRPPLAASAGASWRAATAAPGAHRLDSRRHAAWRPPRNSINYLDSLRSRPRAQCPWSPSRIAVLIDNHLCCRIAPLRLHCLQRRIPHHLSTIPVITEQTSCTCPGTLLMW